MSKRLNVSTAFYSDSQALIDSFDFSAICYY